MYDVRITGAWGGEKEIKVGNCEGNGTVMTKLNPCHRKSLYEVHSVWLLLPLTNAISGSPLKPFANTGQSLHDAI